MAEVASRLEAALLDPRDDVATALVDLPARRALSLAVDGRRCELITTEPIPAGHKVAVHPLGAGCRIRKYGEFIGRMTQAAAAGAWIHSHNRVTSAVRSIDDERAWRAQTPPAAMRPVAEAVHCATGASPVFDPRRGRLHWIDAGVPALYSFDVVRGSTTRTALRSPARAAVVARDGAVLIVVDAGLVRVETDSKAVSPLAGSALPKPLQWTALQCDARGRAWGAAAVPQSRQANGVLRALLAPTGSAHALQRLLAPAGLAWTADGATLYVAESGRAAILRCDVGAATGAPGAPQVFADLGAMPGEPGGMTVDGDDHLWIALPGASCLVRFTPAGAIERVVRVPLSRPTACTFGGVRCARLYVTSAAAVLPDARRRAEPLAGQVLELAVGVAGRPAHACADLEAAAS
jgi:sugar lactone lactonase YvrE